jgi:hypothetical protein
MNNKSGNARKKLNVKEEAEGILLTSAATEDRPLGRVLKANSASKTFKRIKVTCTGHLFLTADVRICNGLAGWFIQNISSLFFSFAPGRNIFIY